MKISSILALTPLLFLVAATPAKRAIVYETVIVEVIETVDIISTIWVQPGEIRAPSTTSSATSTSTTPFKAYQIPSSSSSSFIVATTSVVSMPQVPSYTTFLTSTKTSPAGQGPEEAAPDFSAPLSSSTSIASAPAYFQSSAPAYVSSSTPAYTPPSASAYTPPAGISSSSTKEGCLGGPLLTGAQCGWSCSPGSACAGNITFYSPSQGAGACPSPGNEAYPDTYPAVAIDVSMMGSLSSGTPVNSLCGKTVQITNTANGKKAQGTVVDKCGGCVSFVFYDHLISNS